MKLQKRIMVFAVLLSAQLSFAHQEVQQTTEQPAAVATVKAACHCGPAEHWLYKVCVQNYMMQFPDAGFVVSNDSEGLSENVAQAIILFAAEFLFVDGDGKMIVPTVSAKGNLLLPMSKNADYKVAKAIMHELDTTTTLSAQELYAQWSAQLQSIKSAQ
jgi:hypothetical protein